MGRKTAKVTETKFTIQFNKAEDSHLRVAEILNKQRRGCKAQYIVDAVIHYEDSGGTSANNVQGLHPVRLDEKHIEAVVERILRNGQENGSNCLRTSATISIPSSEPLASQVKLEGSDALDEAGVNAISNALDMFRKK